jgi:hypothetical protein
MMDDLETTEQTSQQVVERRLNDTRINYLERRQDRFEERIDDVSQKITLVADLLKTIRNTGLAIGFILSPSSFVAFSNFINGGALPPHPQYQQPAQPQYPGYPRGSDDSQVPPRP